MRLSMWMIANLLGNLDTELHIQKGAPISLKSARRVYATNCVHIYQQDENVICRNGDDYIIIKDIDVETAFELIQYIFDFYDDWYTSVLTAATQNDYQTVINNSQKLFHNPMVLLGPNLKVIAITSEKFPIKYNEEWNYLQVHRCSSYETMQKIISDPMVRSKSIEKSPQFINFSQINENMTNVLTAGLYYNNETCGRITLLEKKRKFNEGDIQLLTILISLITPHIHGYIIQNIGVSIANPIENLLKKEAVSKEEVKGWMDFHHLNDEGPFVVYVFSGLHISEPLVFLNTLFDEHNAILGSYIIDNNIVSVIKTKSKTYKKTCDFLDRHAKSTKIPLGKSLSCNDIFNIYHYYKQALYAIETGKMLNRTSDMYVYDYFDYGVTFLMGDSSLEEKHFGIHPDIRNMWEKQQMRRNNNTEDELLTLFIYLKNERSILKTSKELFIHRNTLIYRIKKMLQKMDYTIEDSYNRLFLQMSIHILHMYNLSHDIKENHSNYENASSDYI
ncbi:PucR C-terminal helix-turn-helix domain-containing protein [Acetitomaculum ruminis DSM 5522]|uniref:PucR C-terminal helix-turn-helix domain-containing protein n=1 Tax=Acetitomaculum ruminis DSM 5522 TaxID=1120918 RepID=A0A1I0XZJ5_9FIRM|nr:helix-turn-helix domain-containing protein [Acetitomaculum ruminis]SFB06465.1 PucR C-terminal helix-turn-helix domain-containing protein [Acetitomaculum ruminis DSM 5522]